jgi:Ca2+-transporting ATPase
MPDTARGLTTEEARRRLAAEGANELPRAEARGLLRIVWEVLREPMLLMLVAAGVLYSALGEPLDAAALGIAVVGVVIITIVQERRTENALEALRDLSSPRALVIRDGARVRVAGREVVRGDLLVVAEGDRVPADAILREAQQVRVDESLLTGEAVPVRKVGAPEGVQLDPPGGDDHAALYSGTLITAGQGVAEVVATGPRSELGRIGAALATTEVADTPLQRETTRIVRTVAIAGLSGSALVVVAYALLRGGTPEAWQQGVLAGITMAMGLLPEEFPVVLTVFLALGAWRISQSRVLTRRMPAIETLGEATVLCVDKTGTLTENRMTLARAVTPGLDVAVTDTPPAGCHALLAAAVLASRADPFDPMERALHHGARGLPAPPADGRTLVQAWPLRDDRLAMGHAWASADGRVLVAAKGAPEAMAALCGLDEAAHAALRAQVGALASEGLRVLAVAQAWHDTAPDDLSTAGLRLLGLVGLHDPIRPSVPAAVAECHAAGIRVVMITGDYPDTASAIARAAGLSNPEEVLTGAELSALPPDALAARARGVQVFARVVPEQKLRIVQALQSVGEIVAMTGDGVNDAPALKAAHIGIAMGGRGTDVAREAASIVLLDDDFSSIVAAMRLGRRIFDNIRKAGAFITAVHVPIAGLSMLPAFFPDWPLLLLPIHVAFLELVIDPACTLVFEAEVAEGDVMRRPPRRPDEPLLSLRTLGFSALQGASALAMCLGVFLYVLPDHTPEAARALTFVTIVVSALVIILANRSWERTVLGTLRTPNAALWWVVFGAAATLAAVIGLPPLQAFFHFGPVHADDLLIAVAAGILGIGWFELLKVLPGRVLVAR